MSEASFVPDKLFPTKNRHRMWLQAALTASAMLGFTVIVFGGMERVMTAPVWRELHRIFVGLSILPLVFAAGIIIVRSKRTSDIKWLTAALGIWLVQVIVGGLVRVKLSASFLSGFHMGLSLLYMAFILIPTIRNYESDSVNQPKGFFSWRTNYHRLVSLTAILMFLMMVSGTFLARSTTNPCQNWLACIGFGQSLTLEYFLPIFHRLLVALVSVLIGGTFISSWKTYKQHTALLVSSAATAVLFTAQALLAARFIWDVPTYLIVLHQSTVVAVWAAMVIHLATIGRLQAAEVNEAQELEVKVNVKGFLKDLLLLTKPVVVLLLLVTTFAGMVIGLKGLALSKYHLLDAFSRFYGGRWVRRDQPIY
jgi:protoheme IX farnesyltransferase